MTLLTMKEVLQYLHIKKTTFYKYKQLGMPVHYAIGRYGTPYCFKEEIDDWLRERRYKDASC